MRIKITIDLKIKRLTRTDELKDAILHDGFLQDEQVFIDTNPPIPFPLVVACYNLVVESRNNREPPTLRVSAWFDFQHGPAVTLAQLEPIVRNAFVTPRIGYFASESLAPYAPRLISIVRD